MSSGDFNMKNNNVNTHTYAGSVTLMNIKPAVKMLKYQSIAPAPASAATSIVAGKARKYMPAASNAPYNVNVDQTQSVQRRNARERNRVKQVNNSFSKLRQHIPQSIIADLTKGGGRGPQKKISKVDTLRIAVEYIRRLQDLVDELNYTSDVNSDVSSLDSSIGSQSPIQAASQIYYTNVASPQPAILQQQAAVSSFGSSTLLTPVSLHTYSPPQTHLDNACHSPTSSFNSSMSFDSGNFEPALGQQLSPASSNNNKNNNSSNGNNNNNTNTHLNLQLKFEPYDSFNLHEEDCTPDDEEILDYISLWQEQ